MSNAAGAPEAGKRRGDARGDPLVELRRSLARQPIVTLDAGGRTLTLETRHGLFSARSIDGGTALLLRELEAVPPQARVLDLGCGYGAIGLALAARWPEARVTLVDSDIRAVESACANIAANGLANACALLSPGLRELGAETFDLIAANLPAQAGNDALDEILLEARDHLAESGALVVVVVNGLRRYVARRLELIFGDAHKAHQGPRHTVLEARLNPSPETDADPQQDMQRDAPEGEPA